MEEKLLTQEQAMARRMLKLSLEGYTIVDALPDEPARKMAPIPRIQQLEQRLSARLLTDDEFAELRKLKAPAEKEAERQQELDKLNHRVDAQLITKQEYLAERKKLESKFDREDRQLLTEQKPKTADEAIALIWERQRSGKLTIEEATDAAAAARIAWDQPATGGRQLLTEKQCGADCECTECDKANRLEQLTEQFEAGNLSLGKFKLLAELCGNPTTERARELRCQLACFA